MKHIFLISVLSFAAGCSQTATPTWKPALAGGHHIGIGDSTILAFGYSDAPQHSVVFFFPFDINSSTDHTSNPKSRTFDYSGTVTRSPDKKEVLSYAISSTDASKITCNEVAYDLRHGSVFNVALDGTITQLPFAGLEPTKEYVGELEQYLGPRAGNTNASNE